MIVIFSDLDGTLLNSDYSYQAAEKTLERVKELDLKISIVTSKTFDEVVPLWKELELEIPFSYENGNGIASPPGILPESEKQIDGFEVLSLGPDMREIEQIYNDVKDKIDDLKGFRDMDANEVSELTGLSIEDAERAKNRWHSEVFLPNEEAADLFREKGYRVLEGTRFFHLLGEADKGTAVRYMSNVLGPEVTFSIGDGKNDYSMLKETDYAVLLGESHDVDLDVKRIKNKGPIGWIKGVECFLDELDL